MDFKTILASFPTISWDLIILFALIAVGFFYGITRGKAKSIALIISIYISGLLLENFFYLDRILKPETVTEGLIFRIIIFFATIFVVSMIIDNFLDDSLYSDKSWWQALLLSVVSSGLLFIFFVHLFPKQSFFTLSSYTEILFLSSSSFFWWLAIPLAGLFLVRR